jgi:hypothetical protein
MSDAATFHALVKSVRGAKREVVPFGPRHFRLVASLLKCSAVGIGAEPEVARKTLGEAWVRLAKTVGAAGCLNPNEFIPPLRWQHRPAEIGRDAWLHATSRLVSHAEILSELCGSIMQGTATVEASVSVLLARYNEIITDLLALCGGLKLSPRECAEEVVS